MSDNELKDMMNSKSSYCRTMAESMLSTMVGGTITGIFVTPEDDENFLPEGYGFTVKSTDCITREVYVLMDPEGNGPGHLEILDANNE